MVDQYHGWYWQTRELHAWHNEKSVALDSAAKFLQRSGTQCVAQNTKYKFCCGGLRGVVFSSASTHSSSANLESSLRAVGDNIRLFLVGQHYIVTLKWIVWSQLWILGDYTTHATQFSEISSGFLIQSGPIVVVIVDSVPILLLIIKSAQ